MNQNDDLTFREISEMLRHDADAVARSLLPGGRYEMGGREWRCTGSNSPTGSTICVVVGRGAKQGICGFWNEAQEGGDLLDLYQIIHGCSAKEALNWAKGWLGLAEGTGPRKSISAERQKEIDDRKRERDWLDAKDRIRRATSAAQIWKESVRLCDQGVTYLEKRGIDQSYAGTELRLHRNLVYPTGDQNRLTVFPAIIGRVSDEAGKGTGVWRIYLQPTGEGKAPVENAKLGLGHCLGGAVRIGGVWSEIGIAEGIETALACRQLMHRTTGTLIPVWSALSSAGVAGIQLPPEVLSVRIFADNDAMKFRNGKIKPSSGMSAARSLADRLEVEGRTVRIEEPPVNMDWLDVLNSAQQQNNTDLMPVAA